MKLGCSSLVFGGYGLDVALDAIASLGFEAVELCTVPGLAEHVFADQPAAYYADLREAANSRGLVLEAVGASVSLVDEGGRERFRQAIRAAAALGAPCVNTGTGGLAGDDESLEAAIAAAGEMAALGREQGVRLAIRPHVGAAVHNTDTALRLLNHTDPEWVGISFDPTHLYRAGDDPVASLRSLQARVLTAHIRDTGARPGQMDAGPVEAQVPAPRGTPGRRGNLELGAIARAYAEVPGLEIVSLQIVGTRDLSLADLLGLCRDAKSFLDGCL